MMSCAESHSPAHAHLDRWSSIRSRRRVPDSLAVADHPQAPTLSLSLGIACQGIVQNDRAAGTVGMTDMSGEHPAPLTVEYCPVTGVPLEFNDFLPKCAHVDGGCAGPGDV